VSETDIREGLIGTRATDSFKLSSWTGDATSQRCFSFLPRDCLSIVEGNSGKALVTVTVLASSDVTSLNPTRRELSMCSKWLLKVGLTGIRASSLGPPASMFSIPILHQNGNSPTFQSIGCPGATIPAEMRDIHQPVFCRTWLKPQRWRSSIQLRISLLSK
jgi:hypothetical protein